MTSDKPLPFSLPDVGDREIDAVVDVMRSRWLTTGEQCRRFEEEFSSAVGATYAVALNSCTAAMHLSLEALGIEGGDLVFMAPYTFAATAEVVRYLGATPVFVDIDPETLNIDPARLREAVLRGRDGAHGTPRAVMPVHIAGLPCEMDEIWDLARETGLAVVEDAAHAFPSVYKGRPIGSTPTDVQGTACFSFYATKALTTGEGGMLVTEDKQLADRARSMSLHGLSRQAWSRYSEGGTWAYDIVAPGFKYNMTDVAAAMGLVQLARSQEMNARRTEIAWAYSQAFADMDLLQCPATSSEFTDHAWHLYLLRLNPTNGGMNRDDFIDSLTAAGIGTSVHFIPLHLHSYYKDKYGYVPEDFPVAKEQFQRVVSLPIYSAMTDGDVARVIEAVIVAAESLA
jgi:dTDP-4-amino-4,6-dideoxygalactose transaminase